MAKITRENGNADDAIVRSLKEALAEVSRVLALAPAELRTSFVNFEFEDPVPSKL